MTKTLPTCYGQLHLCSDRISPSVAPTAGGTAHPAGSPGGSWAEDRIGVAVRRPPGALVAQRAPPGGDPRGLLPSSLSSDGRPDGHGSFHGMDDARRADRGCAVRC